LSQIKLLIESTYLNIIGWVEIEKQKIIYQKMINWLNNLFFFFSDMSLSTSSSVFSSSISNFGIRECDDVHVKVLGLT